MGMDGLRRQPPGHFLVSRSGSGHSEGVKAAAAVTAQQEAMQLPRPALQPARAAGTAAPPVAAPKTAPPEA